MAENYLALLTGFVLLSFSLGYGGMEALNERLLSSVLWNSLAWLGYLTMHYGDTGSIEDHAPLQKHDKNWAETAIGIAVLVSGIAIGGFYAMQNSYLGAIAGTTIYVLGFSLTHLGLEEKLL